MDQLDLSTFLVTKAQATDFSTRLLAITDRIYENGFNLERTLLEQFGVQKKDKFITLLRENKINENSNQAIKEFINSIQEKITSMPVLTLTVAFEIKEQTLQALSEWMIINARKQILFDIRIDIHIIGGALIAINGKYFDYSIKSKFDRIINETIGQDGQLKTTLKTEPVPQGGHQSIENISMGR